MRLALSLAVLLIAAPVALAQSAHDHGAPAAVHHHAARTAASPAAQAFKAANDKMHADMNIPLTGHVDRDFMQGMIPHHQGAIDMARIVLQYGSDPEVRKLAQAVIDAQDKEIAEMQDWLRRNGK
jgi:uncharacterized protein (DUF305 family)